MNFHIGKALERRENEWVILLGHWRFVLFERIKGNFHAGSVERECSVGTETEPLQQGSV